MWRVCYEPGEVKVVARKDGNTVREQIIRTAGQPHHIRLTIDYQGQHTTFVLAEVVDKDGNRCPWAENQLFFSGDGDVSILATDNGCQTSMERFTSPCRKAFFGRCMAVVKGRGIIKANAIGLQSASIRL
jgi:beta-galactosidase